VGAGNTPRTQKQTV